MLALLLAAGTVAVLPVEARPGLLSLADAAALTDELRATARKTLAPQGFEVVEAADANAVLVVRSRAAQMEGATVVGVGVYKPGSSTPAGLARIVGIGLAQLEEDARVKLPRLLTSALGLSPPAEEPAQRPGTLRMPRAAPPSATPAAQSPAPSPSPSPAPAPKTDDPLVVLIRNVTSDVEKLRGLRRKESLQVRILDDRLFSAAVREKARKELTPAAVAAERARWLAFDLAPPGADPARIVLDVLDEQVAGFYDPFTKQLMVRQEPPAAAGATGPDTFRAVLAHEIEHALQDQNFGIPEMSKLPDDEARLAQASLLEGDAMAVMSGYAALRAHKPIKPAIVAGAALLRAVDTETLLRVSGKSPALQNAPAILREEMVLPYAAGFALVAEAFRRGGFALVDKMFQHPPISGQQVLHPEAYFEGRLPAPVPRPAAPKGTRLVATGRMGELGTRLALEVCADKSVVKDIADKWAGDAYTIVEDGNHSLSLLWTTVWSDGAAANVANLMKLEPPCWEDQAAALRGPGWTIAAPSKSEIAGDVVAVARGSIDLDAALARQLAVRVSVPQPVPPIAGVPPPPQALPPARVESGHFVSPRLALQGDLPPGFAQDLSNPAAEIAILRKGAGGASVTFVPEPLAGAALAAFFQTASAQIAAAQGGHLMPLGNSQRKLAGADAEERAWQIEGKELQVRIDVAPFCGGKGALALLRIESGEPARAALDVFAASIQKTGTAPACDEVE